MKRWIALEVAVLIAAAALLMAGCDYAKPARDAIAGAQAWIVDEQPRLQATCTANPSQGKCQAVNKVIHAQHIVADSLVVYCAGTPAPGVTAYKDGGACVPVKTAEEALRAAVTSLNQTLNDAKALVGRP